MMIKLQFFDIHSVEPSNAYYCYLRWARCMSICSRFWWLVKEQLFPWL